MQRLTFGALVLLLAADAALAAEKTAKYYFKIVEVNVSKSGDSSLGKVAGDFLEKELAEREGFTADLGSVKDDAGVMAELKKRNLKGFRISLRLEKISKEMRPPKPGGRLKQMTVDLKVSVFGTTLPGDKLAFSGEGEAAMEAEVIEAKIDQESASMVKDVMGQAVKQAVDQAVMKLSVPKSEPHNEKARKKRKK